LAVIAGWLAPTGRTTERHAGAQAGLVRIGGEVIPGLDAAIGRGVLRPALVEKSELGQQLSLTLTLRRSDQAGFERFLASVTNPGSPAYHHFLSRQAVTDRFGPSRAGYDDVLRWLRQAGFTRVTGSADRLTITASASRRLAQNAFHASLEDFTLRGRRVFAATRDPSMPAAIGRLVLDVGGLSDLAVPTRRAPAAHAPLYNVTQKDVNDCYADAGGFATGIGLTGAIAATFQNVIWKLGALAEYLSGPGAVYLAATIGSPWVYCFGMAQGMNFRNYFGYQAPFPPPCDPNVQLIFSLPPCGPVLAAHRRSAKPQAAGAAQTLGLLEFDGFRKSDVSDWLSLSGSSLLAGRNNAASMQVQAVNGGVATPGAGESEVLLDVNAVTYLTSMPIQVYEAPPSTSFQALFNAMISGGNAIISNSWAQCEDETPQADAQAIDSVIAQAAADGISVFNGTGDTGSTCLDGHANTVSVPADSPNATAVGATSLTFGPGFSFGTETRWGGTDFTSGTGFGTSAYFPRPSYQNGQGGSSMRSLPDLSLPADPADGMELCQADANAACPGDLMYGGTSLAAPEMAALTADLDMKLGSSIGDVNPALYPLAGTGSFRSPATLGSDFAHVGIGSPDFDAIELALAHKSAGPVSAAMSTAVAASPAGADGTSTSVVDVTLLDANNFPIAGKTVTLTPNTGSGAQVTNAGNPTTDPYGEIEFDVKDATQENVTLTARDATDNVTLTTQPAITFAPPVATGAQISANPTTVADDGTSTTTISVYLQNALGRPAAGKTVSLATASTTVAISPASKQAVTGANGVATFTATDTAQQTVSFTATDVTDGNLPVPGNATVNFQPGGAGTCADTAPAPSAGYTVSQFAGGLQFNNQDTTGDDGGSFTLTACTSPGIAFDGSGSMFVPNIVNGAIYKLGSAGGTASNANALTATTFAPGGQNTPGAQLGGVAFGKQGQMYASVWAVDGSTGTRELLQLDPATGAVQKTILSTTSAMACPFAISVDPLSGDVFATDGCYGSYDTSDQLFRVSGTTGASPAVTNYATVGTDAVGSAFAPDGTIYVANYQNKVIESVTGTNGPATPTVTTIATLANAPDALTVAASNSSGQATALWVTDSAGELLRIDLTHTPATVTTVATNSGADGLGAVEVGPDGCPYVTDLDTILKVSGNCAGSPSPQIALKANTDLSSNPPTGSSASFTATLANVASPGGASIYFRITGANAETELVHADQNGSASLSYAGVFPGADTVTAETVVNGQLVSSAPITFRWSAGKDTSFLALNGSPASGQVGQATTFYANLIDVSATPPTAVAGAAVTISIGSQSCNATTDGSGNASCSITPAGANGLDAVTATYAGSSTLTASTASNVFAAGGVGVPPTTAPPPASGVPANTVLPAISGTAKAKGKLTCSPGTWTGSPTSFSYRWNRYGTPIVGATASTYTVQTADEGAALTCTVTAANATGKGAPATSKAVSVALPKVKGCPAASGTVSGTHLGLVRLGMTRAQARSGYRHSTTRGKSYEDFFCLTPIGIRVGYGSPALVHAAPAKQRAGLRNRLVWISTSNPYFAISGIRAGATLTATEAKLRKGNTFKVGLNTWYEAPAGAVTAIFKARGGVVQEIGIADKRVTATAKSERSFIGSFS
jgi:hypothetical protein